MDIVDFLLMGNVLLAIILIALVIVLSIQTHAKPNKNNSVKNNLKKIKEQIEGE